MKRACQGQMCEVASEVACGARAAHLCPRHTRRPRSEAPPTRPHSRPLIETGRSPELAAPCSQRPVGCCPPHPSSSEGQAEAAAPSRLCKLLRPPTQAGSVRCGHLQGPAEPMASGSFRAHGGPSTLPHPSRSKIRKGVREGPQGGRALRGPGVVVGSFMAPSPGSHSCS